MTNDQYLNPLLDIFGFSEQQKQDFLNIPNTNEEYKPVSKDFEIKDKDLTGHITVTEGEITFVSIESKNGDLNLIFENVMDTTNFKRFIKLINTITDKYC